MSEGTNNNTAQGGGMKTYTKGDKITFCVPTKSLHGLPLGDLGGSVVTGTVCSVNRTTYGVGYERGEWGDDGYIAISVRIHKTTGKVAW